MSVHEHLFSINFGYEQIECARYQHGCNVMIDKDEAEHRINEFPALEAKLERMKRLQEASIEFYCGVIVKAEWRIAVQNSPKGQELISLAALPNHLRADK